MGDLFRLSVVTGESTVLDTEVRSVNLPMDFGSIGILVNHAPMLCAVSKGIVRGKLSDGHTVRVRVSEGVASVADNELTVLCGDAALIED
ncbi:MAG: F0F1 ATP synthase subunit epsilon [Oscillospiraceae bacterium]|nr:F0F1 ATP synthase subunit epsilon [Oscillospiraceae bacterium]